MIGIGCAGWSLPREAWPAFAEQGTHLQRYSGELSVVEINSSFYRPHRPATYRKWAASVPEDFRFCVKMPRQISHELRLRECDEALERFLGESTELAEKLGCLLLQLPPSLTFDPQRRRTSSLPCAHATTVHWYSNRGMRAGWTPVSCSSVGVSHEWRQILRQLQEQSRRAAGRACATTDCTGRHASTILRTRPNDWSGWLVSCGLLLGPACRAGASSTIPPAALR